MLTIPSLARVDPYHLKRVTFKLLLCCCRCCCCCCWCCCYWSAHDHWESYFAFSISFVTFLPRGQKKSIFCCCCFECCCCCCCCCVVVVGACNNTLSRSLEICIHQLCFFWQNHWPSTRPSQSLLGFGSLCEVFGFSLKPNKIQTFLKHNWEVCVCSGEDKAA